MFQRHHSWNKKPVAKQPTLARERKAYDSEYRVTRLKLVDRGEDAIDRFLVYFQGKTVHYGLDYETAVAAYEALEKEYFDV